MGVQGFVGIVALAPFQVFAQDTAAFQNLLIERFRLRLNHETKSVPVYELTVAKGGANLKKSDATPDRRGLRNGYRARQTPIQSDLGPRGRNRGTTSWIRGTFIERSG